MSHPSFERALEIVRRDLYETIIDDEREPLACRIHDAFGSFEDGRHNCLGCNFADATKGIELSLLKIITVDGALDLDFSDYILWLYLFVERATMVFDIAKVPEPYRHRHFDCYVTIKRWANFIKHPNFFVLVHHPDYFVEGDSEYDSTKYSCTIDSKFVREYYGAEAISRQGAIRAKLQNKKDVAVLFPEIVELTEKFCVAAHKFFALAERNEVFREALSDISTFEEYFAGNRSETEVEQGGRGNE